MAVKFELPMTQNSTIVAFMCTLLVAVAFTFRLELGQASLLGGILRLVHLGSFSTWLGVQVWVTFFAGRAMGCTTFAQYPCSESGVILMYT